MEKHLHSSSRHISAECETQTEYGSLAAHTGGGTIDLYLKPLEAEQSSAPRRETLLRAPVLLTSATCRLVGNLHELQRLAAPAGFSNGQAD